MDINSIEQLLPDWQTRLLTDIKVIDAGTTCENAFDTDKSNVQELFPNVWYGERFVYMEYWDWDGVRTKNEVEY